MYILRIGTIDDNDSENIIAHLTLIRRNGTWPRSDPFYVKKQATDTLVRPRGFKENN